MWLNYITVRYQCACGGQIGVMHAEIGCRGGASVIGVSEVIKDRQPNGVERLYVHPPSLPPFLPPSLSLFLSLLL